MPQHQESAFLHSPKPFESPDGIYEQSGIGGRQDGVSEDESVNKGPGLSKRERLSNLKSITKAKTKRLFKVDGPAADDESEFEDDGGFKNIEHDPAFHTEDLVKEKRFRQGKTADKTLGHIKSLGKAVVHPVDSIKSKATRTTAGQLSKADRPYLSETADEDYLQAHENLKRAESSSSSKGGSSDKEHESNVSEHRDKLREIEAHRESLRAAWTTSHHVRRVRVVPKRQIELPSNDYFVQRDGSGDILYRDWLKWLGYNLIYYTQDFSAQYIDDFDELPFDMDSSIHHLERLVMASASWQSWAMSVRAVYRWEDPRTTVKWLLVYVVIWYMQHTMGFLYCYILYIVLRNRYFPTPAESLLKSTQRAVDSNSSATRFGELIGKHGRHDWLEPLIEQLGPYVQLQLNDMANMLEVFSNFYHWKSPKKTVASLIFLGSCLLVSVFADMAFCMKIVGFIAGGAFFVCWPISSNYPKYRYLVSPFKWVLWDIPTHAEWSFQYLRRQAQTSREQVIKNKVEKIHSHELANAAAEHHTGHIGTIPQINVEGAQSAESYSDGDDDSWYSADSTASVLEATDIRSFRAQWHGSIGRLVVFSKGIRYVRSVAKKEMWRRDYLELAEMRKLEGSTVSKLASFYPDQLEIKCIDGSELHLEGMKGRDEAFNTIIAFSSLQWQSLQVLSRSKVQA